MTFEVLQAYKQAREARKEAFGVSVYVFPEKNYIFETISQLQPLPLQNCIQQVHAFNFQFLPIEEGVISLELNDITRDLFIKNDKKVHKLLARYLYKVNFMFGKVNDYVYRGNLSKKVVEQFVRLVWDSELCGVVEGNDFHQVREWVLSEIQPNEDPQPMSKRNQDFSTLDPEKIV